MAPHHAKSCSREVPAFQRDTQFSYLIKTEPASPDSHLESEYPGVLEALHPVTTCYADGGSACLRLEENSCQLAFLHPGMCSHSLLDREYVYVVRSPSSLGGECDPCVCPAWGWPLTFFGDGHRLLPGQHHPCSSFCSMFICNLSDGQVENSRLLERRQALEGFLISKYFVIVSFVVFKLPVASHECNGMDSVSCVTLMEIYFRQER